MKCAKTKSCLRHQRLLDLVRLDWQQVPGKTSVSLPAYLLPTSQRAHSMLLYSPGSSQGYGKP